MANKRKNTVRKEAKQARRLAVIRKGYAEAATLMGVAHLMARLPRDVRAWLWTSPVLDPVVRPDAASAARKSAPAVQAELHRRLHGARVNIGGGDDANGGGSGIEYPVTGMVTFCFGVANCFAALLAQPRVATLHPLAREGKALAAAFTGRYLLDAMGQLNVALRAGAAEHARIDRELISFTIEWQGTPTGRRQFVVVFTLTDPQEREVVIDGKPRPAFRCGGHRGPHAPLEWVDWPAATLGVAGAAGEDAPTFPVWVQRHALRRVEERLGEIGAAAAHFWVWESLRKPEVVRADGDEYTIAYRFLEFRLGYLLARRAGDRVVVTTFVFLTMQGTPESRLLYETLRLRRSEIEYQGLDELATFTRTDLLDDPDLLEIFRQCGCAHLAGLRALLGKEAQAYAAELRKYLRLDDAEQRRALAARTGLVLPEVGASPEGAGIDAGSDLLSGR